MSVKVQIQLIDEVTGEIIGDANPVTIAELVKFADGETFQEKLDTGKLKGQKGDTGAKGDTGEGFSIFKTYASVAAMNADAANVAQGKFVLIASDVENEDNAKLYVKGASGFTFLTDLSGAQGIKGETGAAAGFGTPTASVDANVGTPSVTVTSSGTNTSKVFNFSFKNLKGAKGDTGLKGDTGATGAAGATWLTGTATPTPAQGKDGDWYLNTANCDIYQKASGAWSKKGNIKGAQGIQGIQGVKGDTGKQGIQGIQGEKGDPGDTVKVGTSTSTAVQRKLFFKVIG